MLMIGIDPGKHTGIAIYNTGMKELILCSTLLIHKAMDVISALDHSDVFVRVEDARLRKWFGKDAYLKKQGAGSIKRDCTIWEDFLNDKKIPHEMIHPLKGSTKLSTEMFFNITGYKGRTSNHARDAAMLVFGISSKK